MNSVRNEKTFGIQRTADSRDQQNPGNDLVCIVNHLVKQASNNKQQLPSLSPENSLELEGDEEGEKYKSKDLSDYAVSDKPEDNKELQFTSCPQLGYHMPRSFSNRLLMEVP